MRRGLAFCVLALAGCGAPGGSGNVPEPASVPLVRGAKVTAQATECDQSANAFCGVELVVVDPRVHSSGALVSKERFRLRKRGWTFGQGDIPDEQSASSPDGKLRVTYATGSADLLGIDLGWIKRAGPVAVALSRTMFDRTPTMSLMLESGPA
jgi:hypothetical protein